MKFQLLCLGCTLVAFAMSMYTLSLDPESTFKIWASYGCVFCVGGCAFITFNTWRFSSQSS